jgi:hypothetical protein
VVAVADAPSSPLPLLALLAALAVAVVAALFRAVGRDADEITSPPRD